MPNQEVERVKSPGREAAGASGPRRFVFFSELQGRAVFDSAGQAVGRLVDFKTKVGEPYPRITTLIIREGKLKKPRGLDWGLVAAFDGEMFSLRAGSAEAVSEVEPGAREILLKADLLDKQVVDTSGAKIERVNDVHLLVIDHELRIAHVDFGVRGILRRLGWLKAADGLMDWLFGYRFPEKLVSWKFVQPLAADPKQNLKLNTTLRALHEIHPSDLADILEDLDRANRSSIFKSLDLETAAETLQEVDPKIQLSLIETTPGQRATDILEEMDPDDAKDFLAELTEEKQEELMRTMEDPYRENMEELLRYKEGTAGSIMTKDFIALGREATIAQAIEAFSKVFYPMESLTYIYVTDDQGRLEGVITLRHLITRDGQATLGQLMNPRLVKAGVGDDIGTVTEVFRKYKFLALPVVDDENVIQGIITLQDIVEDKEK
jgi:magnesium transporter